VPTGGTHINVQGDPQFADLKLAVNSDNPLVLAAENANIYYAWSQSQSGGRADPAMTIIGPTGINQCGVVFANTRNVLPEQAPHGVQGLKVSAGVGGTGILRIWSTG
jgi:hypothetical protein